METNPLVLNEGDFTTILEALDCYLREASTMAYVREASSATVSLSKDSALVDEELTNKELEQKIVAKMDKNKVKEAILKIQDQIILLKAKVVHTKEIIKNRQLKDDIDDLLKGI